MDLVTLLENFDTQEKCINHLEKIRWNSKPLCPYCNCTKVSSVAIERRHKCLNCNRSFSVLVGTVFESTKLPLKKWFSAICIIVGAKKGISSLELSRHLDVNKDTAWFLQRRIRTAMEETNLLKGIVEIDETYVGGSMTKMHKSYKKKKNYFPAGMQHKTPVLGMQQREGKIILRVLKKAWGEEIKPILCQSIAKESTVVTDGFGGYFGIGNVYKDHIILNHDKKILTRGRFHTDTIEGFWGILKRAIIGSYHKISIKYFQEYLNEIAFKFNYKKNEERFNTLVNNMISRAFPFSG